MKVLSLFDGMSCGMLAMIVAGIEVERYDAYEIDKYAVTASKHNFPQIEQHGDVFEADFTAYRGYDFLVGGSPCTYWSIAQRPDKRETVASGLGWELFSQYVRALHEANPRMFIYENNKSMSKDIRASITETFGFEPICINSALVSAQNRQRLYWVGVRQDDGTYRKASIEQPADRGILLKDVLDPAVAWRDKAHAETATQYKGASLDHHMRKGQRNLAAEPVGIKPLGGLNNSHQRRVVYDTEGKTPTLVAGMGAGGGNTPLVSEPVCVASRGRNPENPSSRIAGDPTEQRFEAHEDGKTNTLTTVSKNNLIAEPICGRYERSEEAKRVRAAYERGEMRHGFHELHELQPRTDGKTNTLSTVQKDNPIIEPVPTALQEQPYGRAANADGQYDRRYVAKTDGKSAALTSVESRRMVAVPVRIGTMPRERDGVQTQGQAFRIYSPAGKSVTLKGQAGDGGGKTGLYATQEKPTKEQRVYEVKDGMIEVNGKRYPIKLRDGRYIIRKLTVTECMRLQTVPEWYDFSCVSNTQAYKMLGNGWTVEVIAHLIRGAIKSSILGI